MVEIENTFFNCSFFKNKYSQLFRKLFRHIIYGNIKTRYNVFRKYANDVFGEYDFMVQKAYFMKLSLISMRLKARCRTEMMGLIGAGHIILKNTR